MKFDNKNIGIWGFGVVGKAAAQYLCNTCSHLEILDSREPTAEEQNTIVQLNASWTQAKDSSAIEAFITQNDFIIVSPGIDTRQYTQFSDKFIAEFDLFQSSYTQQIVAITGSVGKTTITHLLSHIIRSYNARWWTGGNIGNSVLDALAIQDQTSGAIIEASSFQLDQCKTFAPDLAIITNIYPNHLDRHGTFDAYIQAKAKIFAHQNEEQTALIPITLKETLDLKNIRSSIHFFSQTKPEQSLLQQLPSTSIVFYIEDNIIKAYNDGTSITLVNIEALPSISFLENWLIICAVLFISQLPVDNLKELVTNVALPEHRLELAATINGIDFYNDSKGTTTAATLAAVNKLKNRPIILILGGIGKGVNRTDFIKELKPTVKAIVCFGKEREALATACQSCNIPYDVTINLEQAIDACITLASSGDQIVFSPSGTSFDQFKNYEERGTYFKECIRKIQL
jgi:UDP-N-acetylmuramoylalanine--D-glutamate ligase